MKIKRRAMLESTGLNMTPMIDVVFQLIVFLMLATDFTNTEIERVYLPKADAAQADDHPDKTRLMANIIHRISTESDCPQLKYKNGVLLQPCQIENHWKIVVRGEEIKTQERLEELLTIEGNLDREVPGNPKTPSNKPVMIRADGSAPFHLITRVLEAAGKALVWKLEIGAEKPPE
jgi:biopolymer transport protein ExbD